jgi:hypothetical protein
VADADHKNRVTKACFDALDDIVDHLHRRFVARSMRALPRSQARSIVSRITAACCRPPPRCASEVDAIGDFEQAIRTTHEPFIKPCKNRTRELPKRFALTAGSSRSFQWNRFGGVLGANPRLRAPYAARRRVVLSSRLHGRGFAGAVSGYSHLPGRTSNN